MLDQNPPSEHDKALYKAAGEGDLAGIQAALNAGAKVNARVEYGMTPLIAATQANHPASAALLLQNGAKFCYRCALGDPFWLAQKLEKPDEMLGVMLKYMDTQSLSYKFWDAAERCDTVLVRQFAQLQGFDLDQKDYKGNTGLLLALNSLKKTELQVETATILVDAGINVNIANDKGQSALGMSIGMYRWAGDLTARLLDAGADVYHKRPDGETEVDFARLLKYEPQIKLVEAAALKQDMAAFHQGAARPVPVMPLIFKPK